MSLAMDREMTGVTTAPEATAVLADFQADYLNAMIAGSGRQADQVITHAFDQQVVVNDVYMNILQTTAYEIGRLWQVNKFTVAQEHLATAIIERQMGDMHGLFKPQTDLKRTLVLGCVEKEFHRVGCRMVADFMEQAGWTVYYLGAAVPVRDFVSMARSVNADLIGVSAQMVYHVPSITNFVREFDNQGMGGIPIMAGGLPFVQQPELYRALGVRFSGVDARAAVTRASQVA